MMQNNSNYDVGVFYMPFWLYPGNDPMDGNWKMINDYDTFLVNKGEANKVRIPMNNYWPSPQWYDERMASVTEKQLEYMSNHEIDFVVLDSYWIHENNIDAYVPAWQHVLENMKQPGFNFHGMEFAIMWANDFTNMVDQTSCERFLRGGLNGGLDRMVTYWSQFFQHANYKKIDGKPVFYIYYPSIKSQDFSGKFTTPTIEGICGYCEDDPFFDPLGPAKNEPNINNLKTKYLLEQIEAKLGMELYFVAVIATDIRNYADAPAVDWYIKYDWLLQHPQLAGYDAVTTYGYKYFDYEDAFKTTQTTVCNGQSSFHNWDYNYSTMQGIYQRFYDYMINNSTLDYHVPVTAGFSRNPYNMFEKLNGEYLQFADPCNNYTRDPIDQAVSSPATFEQSLISARNLVDNNPIRTRKIVMISAWNEYAEGTVIEPTVTFGTQYLEKVKNVFM
ncbi:hypothetical protein EA772_01320 [Pedobacter sp. G11]|uniref:glycoside hydrolase family 99-like domain-containing protein n=1 Tax=Pedobacter sp. G11 TaxID=2482728 RepID=UPI000F5E84D2|nr:glycoside hydrolase family 99-like domain-containing protein [Pedobacter sp. G11]AZI24048.1 hypothetical protein EA772_01320 [Pedobacter sp. G11]